MKKLNRLLEERHKQGLTIYDISSKLNISVAFYSLIENGKRNLSYKMAKDVSKILNKKPDDLFYDDIS